METLNRAEYAAQKARIMSNAKQAFLADLNSRFEALEYKYLNNTRVFDTEIEYLYFCREQLTSATLKMIADHMEE